MIRKPEIINISHHSCLSSAVCCLFFNLIKLVPCVGVIAATYRQMAATTTKPHAVWDVAWICSLDSRLLEAVIHLKHNHRLNRRDLINIQCF